MKKLGLILLVALSACEPKYTYNSDGTATQSGFGYNNTKFEVGSHHQFLHVLPNGDSLFQYWFTDSVGSNCDRIYYTTGGKTKTISWETGGKFSQHETVIQQ